jgi:signal transduction histidine kinase
LKGRSRSLLTRLVLGQVMVVVLFSMLTSANLLWDFYRTGEGTIDRDIATAVRSTLKFIQSKSGNAADMHGRLELIDESIQMIANKQDDHGKSVGSGIAMRLFDASMHEVYRSTAHRNLALRPPELGFSDIVSDNMQWRAFTAKSEDGELTLQLMQPNQVIEDELCVIIQKYVITPLVLFLPFAVLITWWTLRKGLAPLRELTGLIAARSPNNMRPLTGMVNYRETAPLVGQINTLLHQLEETLARERSFLADAAHELRTPLAVIQAQAHVLEHAQSKLAATAASEELHAGVERAASLIQKLLLTARVSMEDFAPSFEPVDLSAFTQERIASLSILAQKKAIDIELQAPAHCSARIDRETFRSAFDNVLDNAIRYTPPGGAVRVIVAPRERKQIHVEVADSGIGIAPELRPRVFERFFRVSGTDQQGSGLGLAIVKRVLALHGSEVTLSGGLGQRGLTVAFTLPAA